MSSLKSIHQVDYMFEVSDYYVYEPHFMTESLMNIISKTQAFRESNSTGSDITDKMIETYTDANLLEKLKSNKSIMKSPMKHTMKNTKKSPMKHTKKNPKKSPMKHTKTNTMKSPMNIPMKNTMKHTKKRMKYRRGGSSSGIVTLDTLESDPVSGTSAVGSSFSFEKVSAQSKKSEPENVLTKLKKVFGFLSKKVLPIPVDINDIKTINFDRRRLIYLISINSKTYFIKIAAFFNSNNKFNKDELSELPIKSSDLGDYIYEARIYEELHKQMKDVKMKNGTNATDYITKIYGWDVINTKRNTPFNIKLNNDPTNISININTVVTQLYYSIKKNLKKPNVCSYMITENDTSVMTLNEAEKIKRIVSLKSVYNNAIELLSACFNKCKFVHWDLHHHNILVNVKTNQVKLFDFDFSELNYGSNPNVRSESKKSIGYEDALKCFKNAPHYIPYAGYCYDVYRLIIETYPSYKLNTLSFPTVNGFPEFNQYIKDNKNKVECRDAKGYNYWNKSILKSIYLFIIFDIFH